MADTERLARAWAAPDRVSILEVLSLDGERRTLSPPELAIELQTAVNGVSYHVRVLEIVGLLEVAAERHSGGTHERFYRLLGKLPPDLPTRSE